MLVSQFVTGISAEFSLVRSGNQLTATFQYDLIGFEDENGIFLWDGEIGASIGAYSDYFQQTNDRPMDLQFVATLTPGANTAASYFVNDNIGGAAFDYEFNVVIFNAAANFVGTSVVDLVFGSAIADEFRSNGAGDMFEGGAGDDLYRIYSADTKVFEVAGGGTDRIASGVSYVLAVGVAVEQLSTNGSAGTANINLKGNKLAQTITGNAGDNILDSGAPGAADTLIGLGGNDTYVARNWNDIIVEKTGGGTADRVMVALRYELAPDVEIEIMTTTKGAGTDRAELIGNNLSQQIIGNAGDNRLGDGGGALSAGDVLRGLGGNDIYEIRNAATTIVEIANGGTQDVVSTFVSYSLGAGVHVELMRAAAAAADRPINLTGNLLSQTIEGTNAANVLSSGGAGGAADILRGGGGDDTYLVFNSGDVIDDNTGGVDTVKAAVSFAFGAGWRIEVLTTDNAAGAGAIDLTGNERQQEIIGNAGVNRLDGGGGLDTLRGLGGGDTFVFSKSLDSSACTIADFSVADDTIELKNAVFTGFAGVGALSASAFRVNTTGLAEDGSDRIIYNVDTGEVFYDANGSASGNEFVVLAHLASNLSLTAADFVVA